MKKNLILLAIAIFLIGIQSNFAAPLSKAERKAAISYLKQTKKDFLKAVKGLSKDQLKWKPAPNRWSVIEVSEHITLAESFLFNMVKEQVMKSPADTSKQSGATLEQIKTMIPDRKQKFNAPEPLIPGAGKMAEGSIFEEYKNRRNLTMDFIKNSKEDMRAHFGPHPLYKELDAYLWIIFIAAHNERHTKQILEVKADPNFPRK